MARTNIKPLQASSPTSKGEACSADKEATRPSLSGLSSRLHAELDGLFSTLSDTCGSVDSVTFSIPEPGNEGATGRAPLPPALESVQTAIERVRAMRESMADLNQRIAL